MTRKRTIATMAAFGGMTAAVALLSGQPAAKADELSDLRANQQLLQQRARPAGAGPPAPGSPYGVGGPRGPDRRADGGRQLPALLPGARHRHLDPGRRRNPLGRRLLLQRRQPEQGCPWNTTLGVNGQAQAIPLNIKVPVPFGTAAAVARARGNSIFGDEPAQSRSSTSKPAPRPPGARRAPTSNSTGPARTSCVPGGSNPTSVSDNLHPRLRFAYATLGGLLAGQANSNFSDPDASAETIDFGGTFGDPGVVRVPQMRYTMPLAPYGLLGAFSVSAETPETDAWLPGPGIIGQDAPPRIRPATKAPRASTPARP